MRRPTVVFLLVLVILLLVALHSVSTLIALLFEDASLDAIPLLDLPTFENSTDQLIPVITGRPQLVPKIIHQTYINTTIPTRWVAAQQSCIDLHSDYEYHLWTDEESVEFIAKEYPWFLETFTSYGHNIQRADAIRYFALRHYGGVYIDLDDGCQRRLDPLLTYQAFVRRTIPTGISNDVMGAVPNHPFFIRVTESLKDANRGWILPYITIMASTGPLFLSVVWKKWMAEHTGLAPQDGEYEGRVRVLMPKEYAKQAWSFFKEYKGDSWHGDDARFIFWLGKNWLLVTVVGVLVGGGLLFTGWFCYTRVLSRLGGRGRGRSLSPKRRKGLDKRGYELLEQHDA